MRSAFDRYYERYDAWFDEHEPVFISEIEALKKVVPRTGTGLEIGVGTGRFASSLGIGTGIEPSFKMLEIAKKRGIKVVQGVGEKLPFADKFFDHTVLVTTLCFVKNPQKVLMEAARITKENGGIIIGFVDRESFLGKLYFKRKSIFYRSARFFGVEQVETMIRNVKFVPEKCFQTVFTHPDDMKIPDMPEEGFGKGAFVVIRARKQ